MRFLKLFLNNFLVPIIIPRLGRTQSKNRQNSPPFFQKVKDIDQNDERWETVPYLLFIHHD